MVVEREDVQEWCAITYNVIESSSLIPEILKLAITNELFLLTSATGYLRTGQSVFLSNAQLVRDKNLLHTRP